jgi:hypothetical protein
MNSEINSVVLLQIDSQRIALLPFECNAPCSTDVHAETDRLRVQRMKIEAWEVQMFEVGRGVERIKPAFAARVKLGRHLIRATLLEELPQALMPEAADHPVICNI